MQLCHKLILFRNTIKILFFISVIWAMGLFKMITEYKKDNTLFDNNIKSYENALSKLKRKLSNQSISKFSVWHLLPHGNGSLTKEEKMKILMGQDYPPGINGRAVILKSNLRTEIKEEIRAGWRKHAFNEFVSSLIPVNRTLLDPRDEWCKRQNYSTDLPIATIIICFHNEAWSTLIRTVTSVLNRSPPNLLKQVILVDDKSTLVHLLKPLDDFVASMPKVTLIRTSKRLGVIGARLLASSKVESEVIVYLDSHCECAEGWLEPMLQRIKIDPTVVVSPVVDHIHDTTFEYIIQDLFDLRIGGFTWDLKFVWIGIPQPIFAKRKNLAAPIQTPTISGGLFAINKDFFEKIGYYDTGMQIWGAENLELSFKTWMCGGSLEIIPCSHVGHIFRSRIPYELPKKIIQINYVRLAEVWLDEYAEYYYQRIGNNKGEYGDVSERIKLRKKLNCKSFKWYLQNVYPQHASPDKYVASGQIYSANDYALCLDAAISFQDFQNSINLVPCHFQGGNQFWTYTRVGEIRRDGICLDYLFNTITLYLCNNAASQVWLYFEKDQVIRHMVTEQCLNIARFIEGYKLVLTNCLGSRTQRWVMENFKPNRLAPQMQIGISAYNTVYDKYKIKYVNNSLY